MRALVLLILFAAFLAALGVLCLLFPRAIQSMAVRAVQMGITSRVRALSSFVSSKQYLIVVRAVGLLALLMALFLCVASFRRL